MKPRKFSFKVDIPPAGKQRARAGKTGRFYTPQQTIDNENIIYRVCKAEMVQQRFKAFEPNEPLEAMIVAYYPIPKSFSKKKKIQALEGDLYPTVKPDVDNVEKLIYDSLNELLYPDDKQIVDTRFSKRYAEKACMIVAIQSLIQ